MAKQLRDSLTGVSNILGGRDVLGRPPRTNLELVHSIRSGLSYAAYEAVAEQVKLTPEEAASSLLIPRRTLARRRSAGALDAGASERVVRLARLAARALEVFDNDIGTVSRWLRAPLQELGMASPLSLVDTDVGAQEALDVLGRLEHGVFG